MDIHKAIKLLQIHKSKSIQGTNIRTLAEIRAVCAKPKPKVEIEAENDKYTEEFISALAIVANEAQKYIKTDSGMVKTGDTIEGFIGIAQDPLKERGADPDKLISVTIDKLFAFLKEFRLELFSSRTILYLDESKAIIFDRTTGVTWPSFC